MLRKSAECLWIELMSKSMSDMFTFLLSKLFPVMHTIALCPCLGHSAKGSLSF